MTAAAWSVEANNGSYRTDGTYSKGSSPSVRGAAAGIGREVESTGVFGWVTGDRLRRVKLFTTTGCQAVVKPCGLTTDWSGGVCRRSLGAVTRCSGRELSGRKPR